MWCDHEVPLANPFLKRILYPCLANSGYLRRHADGASLCIVTYHGVLPDGYESSDPQLDGSLITKKAFREQIRLLKQCYNVITPVRFRQWLRGETQLPEMAVLLTCDDGLRCSLTAMAPILKEEGLSCLFFVLAAAATGESRVLWYEDLYSLLLAAPSGVHSFKTTPIRFHLAASQKRRTTWWNLVKQFSAYSHSLREKLIDEMRSRFAACNDGCKAGEAFRQRFSLLSADEIRQLVATGMSVGSHTVDHPILSLQGSEMARLQISESRKLLENALQLPVWALAYPFGDTASVSGREMQMAEQAGFECAFMNVGGGFGAELPRFALPRVHVSAGMTLSEFEVHLSGFHRDFRSRLSRQSA